MSMPRPKRSGAFTQSFLLKFWFACSVLQPPVVLFEITAASL